MGVAVNKHRSSSRSTRRVFRQTCSGRESPSGLRLLVCVEFAQPEVDDAVARMTWDSERQSLAGPRCNQKSAAVAQ